MQADGGATTPKNRESSAVAWPKDPPPGAGGQPVPVFQQRDLLRWALLLAGPVIVCGAVALIGAMAMKPIYAAQAELVFQPLQEGDITEQYRATQTVIVTGRTVLGPVAQTLGVAMEELTREFSATFPKGGAVMQLQYADPDVRVAVDTLNAILDRYTIALDGLETVDQATHRLLVPPFALEDPIQPRPLQALVVGAAVGLAISLGAFALFRRRRERR